MLFAVVSGPSYIELGDSNLVFNYKTGEQKPLYYFLSTKNVGPQKAKFIISSDSEWAFVYREGYSQSTNSVSLNSGGAVNFVLEIQPESLSDGKHEAVVTVEAIDIDINKTTVFDTQTVNVTLNKNYVEPSPTETPTSTPDPTVEETAQPTTVVTPIVSSTPLITATPFATSAPTAVATSPKVTQTTSPTRTPSQVQETKTPQEESPSALEEQEGGDDVVKKDGIFSRFWNLFKGIFGF